MLLDTHIQCSRAYLLAASILQDKLYSAIERVTSINAIHCVSSPITSLARRTSSNVDYLIIGYSNGSVEIWQVIDEKDRDHVSLRWKSTTGTLAVRNTIIENVQGLSPPNTKLLEQHGAKSGDESESDHFQAEW
ncbi:MAG: hypothetical protein J3Q66DRAFT_400379 [Benniella sp.]|nr:MAG: hypothetical protein J3Q66DRAFT_400379 [Benniella sp.]